MTDELDPQPSLDPDEVECPECSALVGQVCRTPTGRKARAIHRARRELAASIQRDGDGHSSALDGQPARKKRKPPSREASSRGGKARAAKARRERAEVEELLVDAKARKLAAKADALAEDSIAWDRDRMALKRHVLDVARQTWATLHEAVEGYSRIQTDAQGKPLADIRETDSGRVVTDLDRRGTFGPDDVKALAVAAGITLDKLRLEEGSATSRSEVIDPTRGAGYADLSDAELKRLSEQTQAALDELDTDG